MLKFEEVEERISGIKDVSSKVDILNEIADEIKFSNLNLMEEVSLIALKYSESIKYTKGIAYSHLNIGFVNTQRGLIQSGLNFYLESYSGYQKINDIIALKKLSTKIGTSYFYLNEHNLALHWFSKALNSNISVTEKEKAIIYGNISHVLLKIGLTKEALTYSQKSLILFKESNDLEAVILTLSFIAFLHMESENLDAAQVFLSEAYETAKNNDSEFLLGNHHLCLAKLQFKNGDYIKSLDAISKAIAIFKDLEIYSRLTNSYLFWIKVQIKLGNISQCKVYLDKAKELANNYNLLSEKICIYEIESQIAEIEGNFELSLNYFKIFHELKIKNTKELSNISFEYLSAFKQFDPQIDEFRVFENETQYSLHSNKLLLEEALEEINNKTKVVAEQNQDLSRSLLYALKIQSTLIQQESDLKKTFENISTFSKSKDKISGDLFWSAQIGKYQFIATIDCTGYGVPTALLSILAHNLLNDIVLTHNIFNPSVVLNKLHVDLQLVLKEENNLIGESHGLEISFIKIDTLLQKIEFSGAILDAFFIQNGDIIDLKSCKNAIGGPTQSDRIFDSQIYDFQSGSKLILFTDGILNQLGGFDNKRLKLKGLKKFLMNYLEDSPQTIIDTFKDQFTNWVKDCNQVDDWLLLALEL